MTILSCTLCASVVVCLMKMYTTRLGRQHVPQSSTVFSNFIFFFPQILKVIPCQKKGMIHTQVWFETLYICLHQLILYIIQDHCIHKVFHNSSYPLFCLTQVPGSLNYAKYDSRKFYKLASELGLKTVIRNLIPCSISSLHQF